MPVERVPTPHPILPNELPGQHENAEEYLKKVTTCFTQMSKVYKVFCFGYLSLLIMMLVVVDSGYYNMNKANKEIFALVILIELCLGTVSGLTIVGIFHRQISLILPLLLLQSVVLACGVYNFLCPNLIFKYLSVIAQKETFANAFFKIFTSIVLRMIPVVVQFLLTVTTIKIILCIHIVQKNKTSRFVHPIHSSSSFNSHAWLSSTMRKIQSKKMSKDNKRSQFEELELVTVVPVKIRTEIFRKSILKESSYIL